MNNREELVFFPHSASGRPGYAERVREVFRKHLEKGGLRLTNPRRRILDFLLKADRHLEQEDIYQALRKYGVGRATVFRTLKLLEESKLADHVTSPEGASRYEVQMERPHHDHLICVECGSIQEVRWPELEKIQEKTCKELGFEVAWHRHEIFGRCPHCASSQSTHKRK